MRQIAYILNIRAMQIKIQHTQTRPKRGKHVSLVWCESRSSYSFFCSFFVVVISMVSLLLGITNAGNMIKSLIDFYFLCWEKVACVFCSSFSQVVIFVVAVCCCYYFFYIVFTLFIYSVLFYHGPWYMFPTCYSLCCCLYCFPNACFCHFAFNLSRFICTSVNIKQIACLYGLPLLCTGELKNKREWRT